MINARGGYLKITVFALQEGCVYKAFIPSSCSRLLVLGHSDSPHRPANSVSCLGPPSPSNRRGGSFHRAVNYRDFAHMRSEQPFKEVPGRRKNN